MAIPFIRSPHNYDREEARKECTIVCPEKGRTQQHQKKDADINQIVKRFGLTGQLPTDVRIPRYGDFTSVGTYQEALNAVKAAQASFMQMPPEIRAKFQNNPELFVQFCSDPANLEEMRKMGLAVPKEEPAPAPAPPQDPPPATP